MKRLFASIFQITAFSVAAAALSTTAAARSTTAASATASFEAPAASASTASAFTQEVSRNEVIVGIGAALEKIQDGSIQVIALIPNSPAENSGLSPGDGFHAVKSQPSSEVVYVQSLSLAEVVDLIRGPAGIPVVLHVTRGASETYVVSIIREKIEVHAPPGWSE